MSNGTELIINKALTDLLETIGQAKAFTVEQIPEVLQQMLVYEFISTCLCSLVWFVLLLLLVHGNYKLIKHINKSGEDCFACIPAISIIAAIILIIGLVSDLDKVIKIKVAPKVYILDYAKKTLSK